MILDIRLPLTNFNLNQMIRDRGGRFARNAIKNKLDNDLYWIIKPQVKERLSGKYEVSVTWLVPTLNRDLDNMLLKSVFDCMQKNDMLENDNLHHIVKICHSFEKVKKEDQGLIIEFKELKI